MIHQLLQQIVRLYKHESANAATEYAVMLSLIIIVSIGAIVALGDKIAAVFQSISQV